MAQSPGSPRLLTASIVAGITIVQPIRTVGGARARAGRRPRLPDLAILALAGVAFRAQRFPNPSRDRPLIPLEGLLVLALVALAVSFAATRAIEQPVPGCIQQYIKTGILQPGVAARRRDRRACAAGARGSDRRALAAGIHPGPVALFDLKGARPRLLELAAGRRYAG